MKSNEQLLRAIMKSKALHEKHSKKSNKHFNKWWRLQRKYAERVMNESGIEIGDSLFVDTGHAFQKIYEVREASFCKPDQEINISIGVSGHSGVRSKGLSIAQCLAAKTLYQDYKINGTL